MSFILFAYPFQRLRTENRLLRQRVDLLEQESSHLADRSVETNSPQKTTFRTKKIPFPLFFSRLIQGQVTRAEVEEHTFAIKRELAAVKQHDLVIEKTTFRFYYYGTEAATMNRIFLYWISHMESEEKIFQLLSNTATS